MMGFASVFEYTQNLTRFMHCTELFIHEIFHMEIVMWLWLAENIERKCVYECFLCHQMEQAVSMEQQQQQKKKTYVFLYQA